MPDTLLSLIRSMLAPWGIPPHWLLLALMAATLSAALLLTFGDVAVDAWRRWSRRQAHRRAFRKESSAQKRANRNQIARGGRREGARQRRRLPALWPFRPSGLRQSRLVAALLQSQFITAFGPPLRVGARAVRRIFSLLLRAFRVAAFGLLRFFRVAVTVVPRISVELALIGGAAGVALLGPALALSAGGRAIGTRMEPVLWLTGAFVLAHLWLRLTRRQNDPVLLPVTLMLCGLGWTMLARTRSDLMPRASLAAGIGLFLLLWLAQARWVRRLERYRYLCMTLGLGLLAATVFYGREVHGAKLSLGTDQFHFQPTEAVKMLLAIFTAGLLADRKELLVLGRPRHRHPGWYDLRYLMPLFLVWGVAEALLVMQNDLGASLLLFSIFAILLYAVTGQFFYVAVSGLLFAGGAVAAYLLIDRVALRITLWWNPWPLAEDKGYQTVQALYALGSGGLTGLGVGHGFPRLLPAVHTDLPFAILGEELGLVGTLLILLAYLMLLLRGVRAALKAGEEGGGLVALGLTAALGIQTIVIVGGITRALPLTGITLPFVSFGGASLVANLALIGMLIHLSGPAKTSRPDAFRLRSAEWRAGARRVTALLALALCGLGGALYYWQWVRSSWLSFHPGNQRLALMETRVQRGALRDRRARVIVHSPRRGQRRYVDGTLTAPVTGYVHPLFGRTGAEKIAHRWLVGIPPVRSLDEAARWVERHPRGNDVNLTLDLELQRVAARALGNRRGSVVALDPRTGELLVLVGHPSFHPGDVATRWEKLQREPQRPLLVRPTQGLYPPGSSFKIVTAVAALEAGVIRPESPCYCGGGYAIGSYRIPCFRGTVHGRLSFGEALARSCNVTFARVGTQLGAKRLLKQAERFGLRRPLPGDLQTARSRIPAPDQKLRRAIVAQIAFGQGPLAVTPMQMAMIGASIANRGVMMPVKIVHSAVSPEGELVAKPKPGAGKRVMRPETAFALTAMMTRGVASGTGGRARLPGVAVAGKTGTAQNPHGQDHAWFIGFAPAEKPRVVVAVLVENAGIGGRVAAPVAREVLAAALGISLSEKATAPGAGVRSASASQRRYRSRPAGATRAYDRRPGRTAGSRRPRPTTPAPASPSRPIPAAPAPIGPPVPVT